MEEPMASAPSLPVEKKVTTPQPNPAPMANTSKPKETPSIFNRKKEQEATEEEAPSVLDKKSEEFSEEDLQQVWKAYSEGKADAGDTDRLILNKKLTKGDDHKVVIHLGSQLEVSFLEKLEVELVQYLRTELKNDHITLQREIAQEEETKKLYTSKDIFEEMMRQNPNLKDLKDRLGLDFDY